MKKNKNTSCNSRKPDMTMDASLLDIANFEAGMDVIEGDSLAATVNMENGVTENAPYSTAKYCMVRPAFLDDEETFDTQGS